MSIIYLHGGVEFDLLGDKFDLPLKTIAYHLSHINRFTGGVGQYSVAQHSVMVSRMLPDHLKMAGLMHDATEAALGDVAAPLKRLLPDYQAIENRLQDALDKRFHIQTRHRQVKEADMRMLATEARDFKLPFDVPGYQPSGSPIKVWSPRIAEMQFLDTFHALKGAY
ncbi:putative helicase [Vibrio phage CKB-S1]|nr:putative helicase [Vibrio phage CKB-S1]